MLLSGIGLGMKAIGSVLGQIRQRKQMEGIEARAEDRLADNQAWYDRNYNEDPAQRANARRLLTMAEDSFRAANRRAAGAAAVAGGTDESIAASKAASMQALADANSQIVAADTARKDQIEQQYMATKHQIDEQKDNIARQKAAATGQAVQGLFDAAGHLMTA